ncbi:MAG TPA: DUF3530 family protein [Pseudomonas sabulinigri]|uniref:DUF3530 domain-containing protein n=1 Tax=marine sediment metagenome TaxID=412755 RepID=A0A0F9VVI0_9ZZZZ|nr:DUF3530 family protein [Halopseudomonas sabulinigri]HEC51887.1 DUF3530 family protein [Halopseudomonas sabulinigri]|tara:strand:+ start:1417 stop:2421 length:1005 start_codon:yes stop_codon:yes gene_type:complete
MRATLLLLAMLLPFHAQAQTPETEADAAPEAVEPNTRVDAPTRSALYEQALERKLPTEEQRQLDFHGESQLGLFLPAARPEALGGVLLIAGPGEHADWPELIAPVRRQLSDAGWNTLSISLPDSSGASDSPPNPPAEDNQADTPDEELSEEEQGLQAADNQPDQPPTPELKPANSDPDYATRAMQLIQAAWQVLAAEGNEHITIIARSEAGYWALRAASPPASGQPPQALILFKPKDPGIEGQPNINLLLEKWDKPLLELFNAGSPQGAIQGTEHQRIARRTGHNLYQQWDIDYLRDSMLADDMLRKRLQGWLERRLLNQTTEVGASPKPAITP